MLDTLTQATFKYKGREIVARRAVDTLTGKFFGWYGEMDYGSEGVAHRSLQRFAENFKMLVDKQLGTYSAAELV